MVKDPAITGGESARVPSWVRFGLVPFEPDHKTDPYLFTIGIQWTIDAWTGALMANPASETSSISLWGTPRRRENGVGSPVDVDRFLGV